MSWEDSIGSRKSRNVYRDPEDKAAEKFIDQYLNSYSSSKMYKLTSGDIDMLHRTARYKLNPEALYVWYDKETGEEFQSIPSNLKNILPDQVRNVFKDHREYTDLELFDAYIERYNNLPLILWYIDSNPYEIKLLKEGKTYPYLILKLHTLFNTVEHKRYFEEDDKILNTFKGLAFQKKSEACSKGVKTRLHNMNIRREAMVDEVIDSFARPEPYRPREFMAAFDSKAPRCIVALVRKAYNFVGRSINDTINIREHCFRIRYIDPCVRAYLKSHGIEIVPDSGVTREAMKERFKKISRIY